MYKWIGVLAILSSVTGHVERKEIINHKNWGKFSNLQEECGQVWTDRIIGGTEADLGEFPWIARLGYTAWYGNAGYRCGGAIISERYVLTAAHCLTAPNLKISSVRVGEYDNESEKDCVAGECADPVQDIKVDWTAVHEQYNEGTFVNDIALMHLTRPIVFNDYVKPVCLPIYDTMFNATFEGLKMDVVGWGVTGYWSTGSGSRVLQKLKVAVQPNDKCKEQYKKVRFGVTKDMICAGGVVGKDSCSGDSGGPLTRFEAVNAPAKAFIFGVVSFGVTQCAETTTPGVYTKVPQYVEWIMDKAKK